MAKKSKKAPIEMNDAGELVPVDGAEAYKAGFTAADCPFPEGDERFDAWNEQFDDAADAAEDAAGLEDKGDDPNEGEVAEKSVVKSEYRARYAEAGHPAHCGDELAVLLNNLCLTKAGIDMPRFEHIMEANGVDLSKYNRFTKGWQGRLRMTGRNMLAGKVFANGGVVKTVTESGSQLEGAESEYRLSADWLASRRKVKVVE